MRRCSSLSRSFVLAALLALHVDGFGFNITRADIAAFTANQFDESRYITAPAISN